MLDKDEIIFAVDEDNNPIKPVLRQEAHRVGVWHRTADVVVVNSKKQILVHKRSLSKDTGPGLWDSNFGGHIGPGVETVKGAVQELSEESGLSVGAGDLKFLVMTKVSKNNNNEFRYTYVYKWDGEDKEIDFEKNEIIEVKWMDSDSWRVVVKDSTKWSPAPYYDKLLEYLNI